MIRQAIKEKKRLFEECASIKISYNMILAKYQQILHSEAKNHTTIIEVFSKNLPLRHL